MVCFLVNTLHEVEKPVMTSTGLPLIQPVFIWAGHGRPHSPRSAPVRPSFVRRQFLGQWGRMMLPSTSTIHFFLLKIYRHTIPQSDIWLNDQETFFDKSESECPSVVSDSLRPHSLYSPWNSLDQNTRVGSRPLLWQIFLTQESNQGLLRCRWMFLPAELPGKPFW